jgi:cobalt transporter subunit CbtB
MTTENLFNTHQSLTINPEQANRLSTVLSAAMVMLLGAGMVLFTLFAPIANVHNATHDTRHAMVAPCH